ncbi:class F sortase [Nocardioides anomalus]|uniref:Class F sortase n=1 Tax=Nocardioides anomalus TaxID=2712223 RepID=A0A6G6WDG3_9ACTN|nr:class F sortase [Nocardioides anomalus]QIG43368.1 class F sortase [Nocardioides anomalus]
MSSTPKGERPARIRIPAIGVDASMTELSIASGGAIEVPGDPDQAGWLDTTPTPGAQGPSVVAGHVDSTSGPAVFALLGSLSEGDEVLITRRDGTTVRFAVDGVRTYPQDQFPTEQVYGPVPGPVLRLITCGGAYERAHGGYQSNVVVYAS